MLSTEYNNQRTKRRMQSFPFDCQLLSTPYPINPYYYPQHYGKSSYTYFPFINQHLQFYQSQTSPQTSEINAPISIEQSSPCIKVEKNEEPVYKNAKKGKQTACKKATSDESEQFKIQLTKVEAKHNKKKNTESNIINQTFSFLCSWKSKMLTKKFFKEDNDKVKDYYRLMAKIKSSHKKYINRKFLKNLLQFSDNGDFHKLYMRVNIKNISFEEIRRYLNTLALYYLREFSFTTLLTSSKIYKDTLMEHFSRKRQILQFLFEKERDRGEVA